MNQTGNATSPYTDADESTATVEVGIGTVGGLPTSGTFTISDPDATQTTGAIAYDASPAAVQAAIQAALTTNWSSATVTGTNGGPYTITNGSNSLRSALVFATAGLAPASQALVTVQQAGSGTTPSIQYTRLQLSPIAYNDTWTATPAPTVTVASVQTGGVSGSNSIQSVTLNNGPYAGTFTLSFGGQTTAPVVFNASPLTVQSALQALSSIGAGNCTVGGSIGTYQVTFIATLAGEAQATMTANAGGLVGPLMLQGSLSLATVGIEEAIGENPEITQTLEIRLTPAGGSHQTVLQVPVTILNDLIPNAPAIPTPVPSYLNETQSDARYVLLGSLGTASTHAASDFDAAGSSATAQAAAEAASIPASALDTDGTLAANSDTKVPSQKAVKTYVDAHAGGIISNSTISGFTGGESTNLDGLATSGLSIGTTIFVSVNGQGYIYRLVAGSFAGLPTPEYVRPTDYDASSNARYWACLNPVDDNVAHIQNGGTHSTLIAPSTNAVWQALGAVRDNSAFHYVFFDATGDNTYYAQPGDWIMVTGFGANGDLDTIVLPDASLGGTVVIQDIGWADTSNYGFGGDMVNVAVDAGGFAYTNPVDPGFVDPLGDDPNYPLISLKESNSIYFFNANSSEGGANWFGLRK